MKFPFKFPMKKSERILGCIYIPIHSVVLPLLLGILLSLFAPDTQPPYQMLIYYTASLILTLSIMLSFLRDSFSDLIDGFWRAVQAIILGYVLYRVLLWLAALLSTQIIIGSNPNTEEFDAVAKINFKILLIVAVVIAPIVEEAMFRGALFGSIRQKNRIAAYIVSALVFAVYHLWDYMLFDFKPEIIIYSIQYIPASIALAWCYERGGTIWAPILLHAAINLGVALQM